MFDFDLLDSPFFIIKKLQRNLVRRYGSRLTGKVLDVGCGRSPYRPFLGAEEYVGSDPNPDVNPDVVADVPGLPFEEASFDAVLCTEVLEHVPEPKEALANIQQILKPGGILYLTAPMSWCLHYQPDDYFRFTKFGLEYLLEKQGFEVLKVERVGGFSSLCAQRKIDIFYFLLLRLRIPERMALGLLAPLSLVSCFLSSFLDRIDQRDALGWAILAKKK